LVPVFIYSKYEQSDGAGVHLFKIWIGADGKQWW
jgi:hypothetical protein